MRYISYWAAPCLRRPALPPLPILAHSRLRLRESQELRKGIPAFLLSAEKIAQHLSEPLKICILRERSLITRSHKNISATKSAYQTQLQNLLPVTQSLSQEKTSLLLFHREKWQKLLQL